MQDQSAMQGVSKPLQESALLPELHLAYQYIPIALICGRQLDALNSDMLGEFIIIYDVTQQLPYIPQASYLY